MTAGEFIEAQDLGGYLLFAGSRQSFLGSQDDLYVMVKDGEKLYATAPSRRL